MSEQRGELRPDRQFKRKKRDRHCLDVSFSSEPLWIEVAVRPTSAQWTLFCVAAFCRSELP